MRIVLEVTKDGQGTERHNMGTWGPEFDNEAVLYFAPVVVTLDGDKVSKVQVWDEALTGPVAGSEAAMEAAADCLYWPAWDLG